MPKPPFRSLVAAVALLPVAAAAQDTRTVVEPRVPPACATLRAALVPVRGAAGDSTLADADEARLDGDRIQRALDGCAAGRAVHLAADGARHAFLSGPLRLGPGVTLVIDSGVTLFASRDPRVYEVAAGSCGVLAPSGRGCRPLVQVERADHAGVMGPGTIDGRGWARLLGRDVTWWDLAQQARNTKLSQNNPRLVQTLRSNDFTLYDLTLRHSPNFHVVFDRGDGFTAWGVVIDTPQKDARNTDGIDPASARNVTITRSAILTGDDNVAIKAGSTGATTDVTVSHSHFYRGHGMSIGSETDGGASRILVTDLTIDGADNGLRIKSNASRGGLVAGVTYERVCIRRTKDPIYMDTHYSASPETTGTRVPVFRDVTFRDVRIVDGGRVTLDGYDAERRLGLTFDHVVFEQPAAVKVRASHADVRVVPGPLAVPLAGDDVRVTVAPAVAAAAASGRVPAVNDCAARFVPMPARR